MLEPELCVGVQGAGKGWNTSERKELRVGAPIVCGFTSSGTVGAKHPLGYRQPEYGLRTKLQSTQIHNYYMSGWPAEPSIVGPQESDRTSTEQTVLCNQVRHRLPPKTQ